MAAEVAAPLDYQSVLSKARLVPEANTEDFWTATCLFGHGLEYSSGSGLCGERFWTIVQEVEGDVLRAEVNNHLLAPDSPRCGEIIEFRRRHIIGVDFAPRNEG